MPDVNVPVVGKMPRGAMVAGLAAVVGVSGYLIYKHITKPTTTTPTATGPTGYGYGYGSMAGSQFGYGYGGAYGEYGGGFGGGGYPFQYGYGTQTGGTTGSTTPTTNAQWGQDAEAAMGSDGTDATAAAIAKYLGGSPVTEQQQLIIQEAIAVTGPVPVPSATGYPPKIRVTKGGGGGGDATNPVTGLHISKPGTTGVDVAWSASAGATSYSVTSTHGHASMIGPTSARIHDINKPGKGGVSATVQVLAEPAASGAQPATIQVKTR
jgi:hypothetical protein